VKNLFKNFIKAHKLNQQSSALTGTLLMFLLYPASIMMDGYVLSRVFKKFKQKGEINSPQEPTNIIMYAGAAHTRHYIDFLRNHMDFKTIHTVKEGLPRMFTSPNCLDMSGVKFPLFEPF